MRALWNGLLGRGEWRDLSWIGPLMGMVLAVAVVVMAVAAM